MMKPLRVVLRFFESTLGKALIKLIWFLLGITIICFLGKYTFFESCISIKDVHNCINSSSNGSDSIVAIGSLLVAMVALIPLFFIENRVGEAKKEVTERVYAQIERSLELVPQAYELLQKARGSLFENRFGDALFFALDAKTIWPRYEQQVYYLLGKHMSLYLAEHSYETRLYLNPQNWDSQAYNYFDVQEESMGRYFIRLHTIALKAIEFLGAWNSEAEKDAEKNEYLSYAYGYIGSYAKMLSSLKQAVRDQEIKKSVSTSIPFKRLALIRACGNKRDKMEAVGNLLGISLPINKQQFVEQFNQADWSQSEGYHIYTVPKKTQFGDTKFIRITLASMKDVELRRISAHTLDLENHQNSSILYSNEEISPEVLFDRIDDTYFIVLGFKL